MTSYVKRPGSTAPDRTDAAVYRFGEPLDELLKVARLAYEAEAVEVPEWRLLLVRHVVIPDHAPSFVDYEVVADGKVLAYSHRLDVLYVEDAADFDREWQAE
jgi:hypothetical protein